MVLLAVILPMPLPAKVSPRLVTVVVTILPVICTWLPTGPAVQICVKFSFTPVKALRKGSPVPSLAAAPTSIICCVIGKPYPLGYLPKQQDLVFG